MKEQGVESYKIQFRTGELGGTIRDRSPSAADASATAKRHLETYYELMEMGRKELDLNQEEVVLLTTVLERLLLDMPRAVLVDVLPNITDGLLGPLHEKVHQGVEIESLARRLRRLKNLERAALLDICEAVLMVSHGVPTRSLVQSVWPSARKVEEGLDEVSASSESDALPAT